LLSKAVSRRVRVQGMRYEGHGWDPKGPASIHRARAALDKDGAVIGYAFESKGFSRVDIDTNESDPAYSLAGQLMGLPLKSLLGFGVPAESYGFVNKQLAWETVAPLLDRASPLHTVHLRDPVGPQILASAAKQSRAFRGSPIEIASSPPAPRNSPSACAI
jgi:nicotinate dehydrogenase subunit B